MSRRRRCAGVWDRRGGREREGRECGENSMRT
jgi:hypothetical protein